MKKTITLLSLLLLMTIGSKLNAQQEGFLGEVKLFAGNFAPRSWALCEGQLLPISQNQALFSILGTMYGGDGRTTFALPDLRGRAPISPGTGPGLSPHSIGQKGGVEQVTLNSTQLPSHTHSANLSASTGMSDEDSPSSNLSIGSGQEIYVEGTANTPINPSSINVGNTGGNQAHTNVQPFLAINYIICLQGVFPSRN